MQCCILWTQDYNSQCHRETSASFEPDFEFSQPPNTVSLCSTHQLCPWRMNFQRATNKNKTRQKFDHVLAFAATSFWFETAPRAHAVPFTAITPCLHSLGFTAVGRCRDREHHCQQITGKWRVSPGVKKKNQNTQQQKNTKTKKQKEREKKKSNLPHKQAKNNNNFKKQTKNHQNQKPNQTTPPKPQNKTKNPKEI